MSLRGKSVRRRLVAAGAGALLLVGMAACADDGAGGSDEVDEVRIGLLFPTTGGMAVLGQAQNDAAKLVLEWANENDALDGVEIKIFEGDSQSDPGVGATVAQRLIDQNDVQIIIGSYASGIAQAIAPVAERNQVVLWEVGAVSPTVNEAGNRYFVRTVGVSSTYAAADIDFLENFLAPQLGKAPEDVRIAVAHEDGPFGSSVGDAVRELAAEKGLNVVANEAYPEDSSDLTPVVLRLQAAEPDVLFITPLVASTPLFWQAAQTQDFNVEAIVGSAGFSSAAFLERFGPAGIEGVYDVEAPAVEYMNSENLDPDARAVLEELRATFKQQVGDDCMVHCGDGLGGGYILVTDVLPHALESGALTADSIRDAAAQTDIPDGGTPQGFGAKFDDNGENERAQSYIMQWQDGKLVVVFPSELAVAEPIFPMPTWDER